MNFTPGQLLYFEDDLLNNSDWFIFQVIGDYNDEEDPEGGRLATLCYLRSQKYPLKIKSENLLMLLYFPKLCAEPHLRVVGQAPVTIHPRTPVYERCIATENFWFEFQDGQSLESFARGDGWDRSVNIDGTIEIFAQMQVASNFFDAPHLRYSYSAAERVNLF